MATQKSRCKKLLADSGKEYQKITDAFDALLKGKISGEEFNRINDKALNNVDNLINEYAHK